MAFYTADFQVDGFDVALAKAIGHRAALQWGAQVPIDWRSAINGLRATAISR
ncbi:MAG: hypothetical protein KF832_14600 [Caldilineaceae bacterium]|nr:hypothetical protein [Caldilineaceae bacterium]